jgi:hypothetical protein
MANYYSSDITFAELQSYVLRELKEPITGSEAIPIDLVEDTLNAVYAEAFNDQRIKPSARETDVSFALSPDAQLANGITAGDIIIAMDSTAGWLSAGKALIENDIITYTGNDLLTNTLTGVTGINVTLPSGAVARQLYPLTTIASDIHGEQINYLHVNGIPQNYMPYERLLTSINFYANTYTIYKGCLLTSRQSTIGAPAVYANALMVYTQGVTPMTSGTEKPVLIPNSWRVPILVYGTCMKLGASDALRVSWDWFKAEYDKALSQYIAFKNNRVRDVNNKRRPTVFTSTLFR